MSIYWVQPTNNDVFATLAAVEQALASNTPGTAPATQHAPAENDPYLSENLADLHANWAVDASRVIASPRPGVESFQRGVRRLTWWYSMPQWQAISQFHAAVVRVIDVLLDRQRLLGIRIGQVEAQNMPMHVFALEQQIQALRDEQRLLRERVSQLEQQLGEHTP